MSRQKSFSLSAIFAYEEKSLQKAKFQNGVLPFMSSRLVSKKETGMESEAIISDLTRKHNNYLLTLITCLFD